MAAAKDIHKEMLPICVFTSEPKADFDCKNKIKLLILHLNFIDGLEPNFFVYAVKDATKLTTREAEVSNINKINSSCSVTTFMRKFTSIRGMGKHFVRNL
jgi:hypothetical protein